MTTIVYLLRLDNLEDNLNPLILPALKARKAKQPKMHPDTNTVAISRIGIAPEDVMAQNLRIIAGDVLGCDYYFYLRIERGVL